MIGNLLKALREKVVMIRYESLTSDKIHEGYFTLKNKNVGRQSSDSNKIVVFDVEKKVWTDIETKTVLDWVATL